jgi:hypothetical protein
MLRYATSAWPIPAPPSAHRRRRLDVVDDIGRVAEGVLHPARRPSQSVSFSTGESTDHAAYRVDGPGMPNTTGPTAGRRSGPLLAGRAATSMHASTTAAPPWLGVAIRCRATTEPDGSITTPAIFDPPTSMPMPADGDAASALFTSPRIPSRVLVLLPWRCSGLTSCPSWPCPR